MGTININDLKRIYDENKEALYYYKINDKTFSQIADTYNIDVDDLIEEYFENGDIVLARLRSERKKLLGKEVSDILTLNGNIIPDNVYKYITDNAAAIINFKNNRLNLVRTINNCDDDELIALTSIDFAMLIVNIDSRNKEIYSDEDKTLLMDIFEALDNYPVITGREAKGLLNYVSSRRLSIDDNTLLYNKIIISGYSKIDSLFEDEKYLFDYLNMKKTYEDKDHGQLESDNLYKEEKPRYRTI